MWPCRELSARQTNLTIRRAGAMKVQRIITVLLQCFIIMSPFRSQSAWKRPRCCFPKVELCAAAAILLTPPSIVTDRGAGAAADQMSASHRRRFRGVFTLCCTPAIYVARFMYAVYNEA